MTVLVLSSAPLDDFAFHRWLRDLPEKIVCLVPERTRAQLTQAASSPSPNICHIEGFADYVDNPLVELRAQLLHEEHRFTRVLAAKELDVLRAARLRESFQIPGQGVASATAFRDKAAMKTAAVAAGIEVPPFRAIASATDLIGFVRAVGFPIVLKPVAGVGAVGFSVLRSMAELERALPAFVGEFGREDRPLDLIAERYVPHQRMYHVDGLVRDGALVHCWPSRYLHGALAFKDGDESQGRWPTHPSVLLAPGDPMVPRLRELTGRLLCALPTPRSTIFHAELFHTADDRLLLCEIASRAGGGLIPFVHEAAFGLLFQRFHAEVECGKAAPLPEGFLRGAQPDPAPLAGRVLFLKRPGRLLEAPPSCPFPWVHAYRLLAWPGSVMSLAAHCVDAIAAAVVIADDERSLLRRIDELTAWFTGAARIEPPAPAPRTEADQNSHQAE
jgi:hypothetical protein